MDGGAEHRFPGCEFQIVIKVGAPDAEVGMLSELDTQIEVAGVTSTDAVLPFTGEADELAFPDAGRNFHSKGL